MPYNKVTNNPGRKPVKRLWNPTEKEMGNWVKGGSLTKQVLKREGGSLAPGRAAGVDKERARIYVWRSGQWRCLALLTQMSLYTSQMFPMLDDS